MRLLFSIAIHESNLSVESLIRNLLKFAERPPIVVLHISANFSEFDSQLIDKYDNVYCNDIRLKTGYLDGSLLRAHVLNMSFAEKNAFNYDYFVPFGSNQMLIKSGIEKFIYMNRVKACKKLFRSDFINLLIFMDWKNLLRLRNNYGITEYFKSSPEGTYWPRESIQENLVDLVEYCNNIRSKKIKESRTAKYMRFIWSFKGYVVYPLEELILPTFLLRYLSV